MQLRFYDHEATPAPASIFLAGPTARANVRTPWRTAAIEMCARAGFIGELVLPEFEDGVFHRERFDDGAPSTTPGMARTSERILAWETSCIDLSAVLLVWMPFTISDDDTSLPGFTTRAEVARAIAQRRARVSLGMPQGAISGGHIRYHAHRANYVVATTLEDCVARALSLVST